MRGTQPWRKRLSALVGAIACSAALCTPAQAAEKLTILVGGVEKILYLPVQLAQQLGYFKDEGIDAELVSVASGSVTDTGLISNSAQAAVGAYEQSIHLQAQGKYVTSIVQLSASPQEVLLVSAAQAANVKTVADLKGKVVGVTGFGTLTHFLTQDLVAHAGLKPSDVHYLSAGAGNTFVDSMRHGRIDAGMTQEPTVSVLLDHNDAKILADLRTPETARAALGGDYPGSCVYVRADWLQQHKDTAQKLANVFARSLRFIATHSAEQIADKMPVSYYNGNKALYVEALARSKASFTPDGKMPADGPKTVLDVLTHFGAGVSAAKIDLNKTYTNDLVAAAAATTATTATTAKASQ
ncbi:ABC transporter substrate-binding protein [Paraburkholderia sp. ZP32-5]|uniref:ABC transporter substrate-binding protein n=1 Tax=Paraburkholderia sp. ZP32-5 TaxID=2883245 RepID=UPI001F41D034|nr:ABC transporter substrate-binding protein [Paraburkholderia sp. ZP32-5]